MFNGKQGNVRALGYGLCAGYFSFAPNGTSNPTAITGPLARFVASVTYSATGIQTVVFTPDFVFANAPTFLVNAAYDSLANYFSANQVGAYNATTRTLVIQLSRAAAGQVVAANAGASVNVAMFTQDSTGK